MLKYFEALLIILLILTAISVSTTKKTLNAIIIFTTFSLSMSILWIIIKAPDLGITEAAVGAGVTSLLFYVALRNMGEIKLFDKKRKSKNNIKKNSLIYNLFSVIFTIAIISTLLYTVSFLPQQGSTDVPALNEVFTRYIESGVKETGAINIVAAVILDYRAFDTFGEATMLFTATIAVVSLIRKEKDEDMIYEEDYKR